MIAPPPRTPRREAPRSAARVRVVLEGGRALACELAVGDTLVVGRDPLRADVVVPELGCAPVHLRLTRATSNQWVAYDLGAASGTLCVRGIGDAPAVVAALAATRAELRAISPSVVAALTAGGLLAVPASGATHLRARAERLVAGDVLVVPGAMVCLDDGAGRAAPWLHACGHGLEHASLEAIAAARGRWLMPVVAHAEVFADAPRIPGRCAELDGAGFAALLRRLAARAPERGPGGVELAFHVAPDGAVAACTGAVIDDAGAMRWVARPVARDVDLVHARAGLAPWIEARTAAARALVLRRGLEVELAGDADEAARRLARDAALEHLVVGTGERTWATSRADPAPRMLTPAEAACLFAYVAGALDGAGPMAPEAVASPFSTTVGGRQQAFKTMRMKVDCADGRGRHRLFQRVADDAHGRARYVFAPRDEVAYGFVLLASDLERARATCGMLGPCE